jgi:hypothetical protein
MTAKNATTERGVRRSRGLARTAFASVALLAVIFALLAERIASGQDPVLRAAAARSRPRPLVVHQVLRRVIVETTVSGSRRAPSTTVSSTGVPATTAAPELVTRTS